MMVRIHKTACFALLAISFFCCSHQAKIVEQPIIQQPAKPPAITPAVKEQKKAEKAEEPWAGMTITLNFQNAKLTDVLQVIAREFKANIVIPEDDVNRVTVYLYNATLEKTLDMILSSLDYAYLKQDQTFMILKKNAIVNRIYRLRYAKATELLHVLEGLTEAGRIKADELTNSIIIVDLLGNLKMYDEIIESLDSFQPSVLIEAEIFEVSVNDLRNLGIDWNLTDSKDDQQYSAKLPYASSTTGVFFDYHYLKAPQIQVMLRALRTQTTSHLLSSPRIMTMNGQEAKILVGERVPYIKTSTSSAAGQVQENIEFVDVGILLKVTPRIIVEEGLVFLDVQPEVSEVLDMEVQGVPRIGTREAYTRIAVKNGETAIIGGLIKKDKVKGNSSLPFIASIPLVNIFFKNRNDTNTERELIVFITPHILTEEHYSKMGSRRDEIKKERQLKSLIP
jgi:type II secretory pathway component GspD/PulD (secretin)